MRPSTPSLSWQSAILGLLSFLLFPRTSDCQAQEAPDTLRLTLEGAEARLVSQNLGLLAARQYIGINQALELQARLLPNPEAAFEYNLLGPSGTPFYGGANTQTILQVQQLIELGGKRGKRVALQQAQTERARREVEILMRSLAYELRLSVADWLRTQGHLDALSQQTRTLEQLVERIAVQVQRGNLPISELNRLRAELFSIQNEAMEFMLEQQSIQSQFRVLLHLAPNQVWLPPEETAFASTSPEAQLPPLSALVERAKENRPEAALAQQERTAAQAELRLAQAQAVPDPTVGVVYDRRGSAWNNYVGLQVAVPIPAFNRNQGNREAAKLGVQLANSRQQAQAEMLENEVVTAYNQWQAIQNQRANRDTSILADFNVLGSRLAQNYQQGRITLLEFLDYYSTLHTLIATEADFRHRWLTTREALNFAVGQRILP